MGYIKDVNSGDRLFFVFHYTDGSIKMEEEDSQISLTASSEILLKYLKDENLEHYQIIQGNDNLSKGYSPSQLAEICERRIGVN